VKPVDARVEKVDAMMRKSPQIVSPRNVPVGR
jgi:hypothetical protein